MKFTRNDIRMVFARARKAFYNAHLEQTEHAPEERLRRKKMLKIVKIHTDDFFERLINEMAETRNVPARPSFVFTSYETPDAAVAGIFAAASRVAHTLREVEFAPEEFIDRCNAAAFGMADYLLKKQP